MKIHHVGYLVKRLEQAVAEFRQLGYSVESLPGGLQGIVVDDFRHIRIVFMKNDDYRVELVEPMDQLSPVYGLLKKYKNSPYHICYCCESIEKASEALEKEGWVLFDAPKPAPAIGGKRVAFFMGRNSGMMELVEDQRSNKFTMQAPDARWQQD